MNGENGCRDTNKKVVAYLIGAPLLATWHFWLKMDTYWPFVIFTMQNMKQMSLVHMQGAMMIVRNQK